MRSACEEKILFTLLSHPSCERNECPRLGALEILRSALVFFGGGTAAKRAWVPAAVRRGIQFARIEAIFPEASFFIIQLLN
jgi:hypothetical protein